MNNEQVTNGQPPTPLEQRVSEYLTDILRLEKRADTFEMLLAAEREKVAELVTLSHEIADRNNAIETLNEELERKTKLLTDKLDAMSDRAIAAEVDVKRLTDELTESRESAAKEIIKAGLATGHGDTVIDLVHEALHQATEYSARATTAEAEVARLRGVIERAPHGEVCLSQIGSPICNCWKSEALKEQTNG